MKHVIAAIAAAAFISACSQVPNPPEIKAKASFTAENCTSANKQPEHCPAYQ